MNRLQEFLDNPHIITGTATVAADPQLTLIAANKALYTLVGETAESCRQQGNSLLPWIEQSSAVRLIGLLAGHPPLFDWEGVLVRKDATSVRIRLSGTRMEGVLHKGQYPVYLSAFTDLACVEEMLRSAEYERRKYALIADISEDLPFEYDFETDTIAYTQKYHKVFGHEPVIPRFRERLGRGEAIDPVSEGFREPFLALDAEKASTEAAPERFLPTHSGRKRWFALYSTNILDTLGKPVKSVGALRDIDRQKREQLRLLDKSRTDSMTGLYNKVTTEEEIRIALRDARPGSSGVLFMIDIDNFKDVNDSMGHLAGDSIIMEIARQLRRTFRQDDIIGRVGGDEFHVYMRDVSEIAGIRTRAQSLCSSIRNLFKNSNIDNAVSVSVGIAVTERPIAYEDLFRAGRRRPVPRQRERQKPLRILRPVLRRRRRRRPDIRAPRRQHRPQQHHGGHHRYPLQHVRHARRDRPRRCISSETPCAWTRFSYLNTRSTGRPSASRMNGAPIRNGAPRSSSKTSPSTKSSCPKHGTPAASIIAAIF